MDSKKKHPFNITCRYCGSNHVKVYGFDYSEIELRCVDCGKSLTCGMYDTMEHDYSNMH